VISTMVAAFHEKNTQKIMIQLSAVDRSTGNT